MKIKTSIEGKLVLHGFVPSVTEITRLMKNKDLLKSKLFQLHSLSVAVDMSAVSENALAFAWKMAHKIPTFAQLDPPKKDFEFTIPFITKSNELKEEDEVKHDEVCISS
jgi:hypothetical protein